MARRFGRLKRAAAQRMEQLERIHRMDWTTTELREEGEGKRAEHEEEGYTDLVMANSQGGRKRKWLKKLRWSTYACRRAAEKGVVSRNVRRAGRRLKKKEEDKDSFAMELETWVGEDTESYSFVKIDKIESCMKNLSLGQAEHQELYETLAVETAFMDLRIEEDQAEQWEMSEHCWLEKVELKEAIVPLPISKYFGFGEEQAEHQALDGLLTEMSHMDLGPETIVEFRLCCDNCVNCWETNRIHFTSRRNYYITSSVCLNVPTNVTNFTTLTGASGARLQFSKDEGILKDRLGKSLELTELSSKQEQLEMVDMLGKTMVMTELPKEHEQVDRMNKSWVLTEMSSEQ